MDTNKTFIIAEAGVNHNGSINMAYELIDVAAEAGADAIKFQTFKAESIVTRDAQKAGYQKKAGSSEETQYDMLKKLELSEEAHALLIEHCQRKGIMFMSTPFDIESVDFLVDTLGLGMIKIASGEITNAPLLFHIARKKTPVILSTGMSSLGEIESALSVLAFGYLGLNGQPNQENIRTAYYSNEGQACLKELVSLLHCTSEYPAPFQDVNLKAMDTMRECFGLNVGLSDHTNGIAIPIAAVARGARIIEKHFTLDRKMEGPDHKASLEPNELKAMVSSIREVEMALGSPLKQVTPSELININTVRKSVVASCDIDQGELFTEHNLSIKRPGTGLSPFRYWDLLGKPATRSYKKDDVIQI